MTLRCSATNGIKGGGGNMVQGLAKKVLHLVTRKKCVLCGHIGDCVKWQGKHPGYYCKDGEACLQCFKQTIMADVE